MADVGKKHAYRSYESKKLIVRPTLAGFGVVVADCATCGPRVDYVGCIVADVGARYLNAYMCDVGSIVAYDVISCGPGRFVYEIIAPSTVGT